MRTLSSAISLLALLSSASAAAAASSSTEDVPQYDPDSYDPVEAQCAPPPLTFRSAFNTWDGKTSNANSISVSGGGWNKVHAEITSRTLQDGETFAIQGDRVQVGVGLCLESKCDLETSPGIRWNYECVGFYGGNSIMFATDEFGEEYEIDANRPRSSLQGFTYNASDNCVVHVKSWGEECTPLPEHFRGEEVRAKVDTQG